MDCEKRADVEGELDLSEPDDAATARVRLAEHDPRADLHALIDQLPDEGLPIALDILCRELPE